MYVYVHVSRNWVTKRCDSRTQDDVGYVYMNMPEWVVPFPAIVALVGVVHGRTCGCTRRNNSNNMFNHSVHQAHIIPASVQVQGRAGVYMVDYLQVHGVIPNIE